MDPLLFFTIAAIIIPIIFSLLVFNSRRAYNLSVVASLISFLCVLCITYLFLFSYGTISHKYEVIYYRGIELGFIIDTLSVLISFMVAFNGLATIVFSKYYMSPLNKEHPIKFEKTIRFYSFLLIFESSALGFIYSSTLLSMIIFFELTSICSFFLIGYYGTPESRKASFEALIVTHIAAMGLYVAAGITYAYTGSLNVVAIKSLPELMKTVTLLCLLVAAMGKSAQVPTHTWLPHAMVAPTPVSAYLHAAAMVKLGVYLMLRVYVEVGFTQIVTIACLVVGLISMMYGCIMYFPQRDLKRLLAYSTITQLSYILTGVGIASLGSSLALQGAALHIFNHGFAKELFFLTAGLISYSTGTRLLNEISGLKKIKGAAVGFIVAAMSITGIPPFNCFWSKISIIIGGYQTGTLVGIIASTIILFESLICFIWFLRILTQCIMGKPSERVEKAQEVPNSMKLVIYSLVLFTLISPIIAGPFLRLLINP